MFRTKGMAGFTLYPDKAYLEIKVKLYNRTPHPQTFLWWANPAVKVNDDYQSVFPPDVNAVYDHGKRDVSTFPIATGTYYKVDYSTGVDISRYKNIPVPTSYMAVESKYDFVGCYENDTKGGMIHIANHNIAPGKKQWTWGNGDFGHAWDRNLTDEDGPYIELMCGVYTDNQPDFSWIMPYEEKNFKQYFMPYHKIGYVKNACKEALLNLEIKNEKAFIGIYVTQKFTDAKIILETKDRNIFEFKQELTPESPFTKEVEIDKNIKEEDLLLKLIDHEGNLIISWHAEKKSVKPIPEPATAAKRPEDISNNEQLYLTALHLEQYRHATWSPIDYYEEALKRDKGDLRSNNALGLLLMKRGLFGKAEFHFRNAINTITERNPNPYDGEPYFNLGLALRFQHREDEAFTAFYKAVWNDAYKHSGYFQLAQIASGKGQWEEALELVENSLIRQWHNHKARHLKASILRKIGEKESATYLLNESLKLDNFNFGILFEKYLLNDKLSDLNEFKNLTRNNIHTIMEYALDYYWAGMFNEAEQILNIGIEAQVKDIYPLSLYYLGWFAFQKGDKNKAKIYFDKAEEQKPDYCFPNQIEAVLALKCAIDADKSYSKAPYYLGNFYYHSKQYTDATALWELSAQNDNSFPTVHRNLSLAYFNKQNNPQKALASLEIAFKLDEKDARVLMELDSLYKRLNKPYNERLAFLENYPLLVEDRDDLTLERITLLNLNGQYEIAYQQIMSRKFHPWEGGEGKVTGQYILSLTEMAKHKIKEYKAVEAIELLEQAKIFPNNLGEGKLVGAQVNDINYWLGCANEILNNNQKAIEYWKKASTGSTNPSIAMYYNDQQPDKIFYQGLALLKLGETSSAKYRFQTLLDYGKKHLNDQVVIDYFAVSLPDLQIWENDLNKINRMHCMYLMALGYFGLGKKEKANKLFKEILEVDGYFIGAHIHQKYLLVNFN
jgi:tetratricopeptide (TPR) repeat protein